ncbi:MAG TPA: hypothetical protein H9815_10775 [Candidatus Ruania gallistercoris]|uniref:Uncharacterized protein n=1 Tax=Candidatus Ruania gallistercoris TaxID=2838746 RepID=A0A9D2EEJ8_9MICO|nr:hypothetical protein [Candidatus Ruania gallistercoris]
MAPVYALFLGPVAAALVLAVLIWLRPGSRGERSPGAALRGWTIAAAAVPLLVVIGRQVLAIPLVTLRLPYPVPGSPAGPWFVWPILLGLVALVLLLLPLPARRGQRTAELSRRTMWTFTSGRLFVSFVALLAVTVAVTVAAGLASEPDEGGRYRTYSVQNGDFSMGTQIYGWYYSVPALVLLAVTVLVVIGALILIARPRLALEENRERDMDLRRLRSRNVILTALGGVAVHLGLVLASLSATSTMRGSVPADAGDLSHFGTPFAALTSALAFAGACLVTVGLTAWLSVLLSVIPVPHRSRTTADRP